VLLCLLVFSIALHAQEHSENNTMENPFKNGTEIRSLSVEMGPSWINSKIYTSEGDFTKQAGVELGVEYAGIKVGGIDYGISFYHNETNIHGCKVSLNYIGPSLTYAHLFHQKWLGKVSLGLGVGTAHGKDDGYNNYALRSEKMQFGLGTRLAVGMVYLVSDHIGFGLNLHNMAIFILKKEGSHFSDSNEINGISRIGGTLAFHYFF
ncbi:MAG: outer membrane beta-barrel protein, partial [Prevotella sp.]|nr:outer membrane beta-barrel protein [Prevotella sp.]